MPKSKTRSKTIRLYKEDILIKRLISKLTQQINKKAVHTLLKEALLHYVHTGQYLCIAKISPESLRENIDITNINSLYLYYSPENDLNTWILALKKQNINSSERIRNVIKNSITLVNTMEEEWFPDQAELEDIIYNETIAAMFSANQTTKMPSLNSSDSIKTSLNLKNTIVEHTQIVHDNKQSDVHDPENFGTTDNLPKPQKNTKPLCSSMFSDDDW